MRSHEIENTIDEELQAHIADCIDAYMNDGLTRAEAEQKARAEFGDIERITQEVAAVHHHSMRMQDIAHILLYALLVLTVCSLVAFVATRDTAIGATISNLTLTLAFYSIATCVAYCSWCIVQFYGLTHPRVLLVVASWTLIVHISITIILDIDKFEGVLHSLVVVILSYGILALIWKKISLRALVIFTLAIPFLITLSALHELRVLNFLGTMRCLFITPDNIPLKGALASCTQVSVLDHVLWPIYLAGFVCAWYIFHFIKSYVASPVVLRARKICVLVCTTIIVCAPLFWRDVNNTGILDIVPWTQQIYAAYDDALGRGPQEKDMAFYALTRSYEHMDRVKDVLYRSKERALKINLVFQEILKREPTDDELNFYLYNRASITDIYAALEAIRNALTK